MTILDRETILEADDLNRRRVQVPEWSGEVLVRALTAAERDAFEADCLQDDQSTVDLANVRAKLVARTVVDEEGDRVFRDSDVDALGRKSGAAVNRIWRVASELSGITEEDAEELAGN